MYVGFNGVTQYCVKSKKELWLLCLKCLHGLSDSNILLLVMSEQLIFN